MITKEAQMTVKVKLRALCPECGADMRFTVTQHSQLSGALTLHLLSCGSCRAKRSRPRFFIVPPTVQGQADGDTEFVVCSTTKRCSFDEIYMNDWFVDEGSFGSLADAKSFCYKKGYKRPFVLA